MSPVSVLLYDILDADAGAVYLVESVLVTVEGIELVRRDLEALNELRLSPKPRRGVEMTKYERGTGGKVAGKRRREVMILIFSLLFKINEL